MIDDARWKYIDYSWVALNRNRRLPTDMLCTVLGCVRSKSKTETVALATDHYHTLRLSVTIWGLAPAYGRNPSWHIYSCSTSWLNMYILQISPASPRPPAIDKKSTEFFCADIKPTETYEARDTVYGIQNRHIYTMSAPIESTTITTTTTTKHIGHWSFANLHILRKKNYQCKVCSVAWCACFYCCWWCCRWNHTCIEIE